MSLPKEELMDDPTKILFIYAMPKGTDYLDKIKEEIDYIKLRILDGYNVTKS